MELFKNAKQLRKNSTDAEKILWEAIRNRKLRVKFRRQVPIKLGTQCGFIADFCCLKKKLIIEVDGSIHDSLCAKEHDKLREDALKYFGYKIIRFRNEEIIRSVDSVLNKILELL